MTDDPLTHVDVLASLTFLDEKRASLTEDAHRRALDSMRARLVTDITGDIEPALAASHPTFSLVGHLPDGSSYTLDTPEAIRGLLESLTSDEYPIVLWIEFDHIVIDGRTFAVDGVTKTICERSGLAASGLEAPDDGHDLYLVSRRVSTMVEFADDGRLTHEVVYMSPASAQVVALTHPQQPGPREIRAAAQTALDAG